MLLIKQLQNLNFDFSKLPADVKMSIDVIEDLTKGTFNDTNNQKIEVLDNAVFTAIKNLYPKDDKVIEVSISRAVDYFENENAGFNTVQEESVSFKKGGNIDDDRKEIYKKWKDLVNMSASELISFMNSVEGKEAGLSKEKANKLGIHYGRESAKWILKMKETPVNDWTDNMWEWAKRQVSFNSRMRGNKGDLYDSKGRKTRKHTSLLIWGHNPEKYENGGVAELTDFNNVYDTVKSYIDYVLKSDKQINEYVPNTHIAEVFKNVLQGCEKENMYPEIFHNITVGGYDSVVDKSKYDYIKGKYYEKEKMKISFLDYIDEYFNLKRLKINGVEEIHNTYQKLSDKNDIIRNNLKLIDTRIPFEYNMKHKIDKDLKSDKIKIKKVSFENGGVAYHGSPILKERGVLTPSKSGELGAGAYFTRNHKLAENYSLPRGEVKNMAEAKSKSGIAEFSLNNLQIKKISKDEYLSKRSEFYDTEQKANNGNWSIDIANEAEQKLVNYFEKEGYDGLEDEREQQGVIFPNSVKKINIKLLQNLDISFKEGGSTVLTVYHGTQSKFVADIKKNGLKDKSGYNQGWYMVSTDMESALFHATPDDKKDFVYVFEFEIPIIENDRWLGYPYLWKGMKRNDNSSWFALMERIPKKFIKKIYKISYADYLSQKDKGFKDGGSTLLAPNGNPSSLTPEQYALVRTPEFKKWFGHWENDLQNASKAIDENLEPLVLYHGTDYDFNVFDSSKIRYVGSNGDGFYLSPDKHESVRYGSNVRAFFANIKHPISPKQKLLTKKDYERIIDSINKDKEYRDDLKNYGYFDDKDYVQFRNKLATQLSTGDDYTGLFDLTNTVTGSIRYLSKIMTKLGIERDGVISPMFREYVAFVPEQIKLADGTNIEFNSENPDVRFDDGGTTVQLKIKDIIVVPTELKDIYDICKNEIELSDDSSYVYYYSKVLFDCLMQYNKLTHGKIDIISDVRKLLVKSHNAEQVKQQYEKITQPSHVLPADMLKMINDYMQIEFANEKLHKFRVHDIIRRFVEYTLTGKIHYSETFKKQLLNSKIKVSSGAFRLENGGVIETLVYHGTDKEFNSFDKKYLGSSYGKTPSNMKGFFFTDNPDVANTYGKIVKTYNITLNNPLIVDAKGKDYSMFKHELNDIVEKVDKKYDGVIIQNYADAGIHSKDYILSNNYIVFNTSQIKPVEYVKLQRGQKGNVTESWDFNIASGQHGEGVYAFPYGDKAMQEYYTKQGESLHTFKIPKKYLVDLSGKKLDFWGAKKYMFDNPQYKAFMFSHNGVGIPSSKEIVITHPEIIEIIPEYATGGNIYHSVGIEGNLVGKSRNPYIGTEKEIKCSNDDIRCFVSDYTYRFIFTVKNKNVSVLHFDKEGSDWILRNAYTLEAYREKGYAKALYEEAKKHLKSIRFSRNLSPMGVMLKESVSGVFADGGVLLYHGTDDEFDTFDIEKTKKWDKFGLWFSDDKQFVETFGNKIKQAIVKIDNPKVITYSKWNDIRAKHAKDSQWFSDWKKELIAQGYDGLKVKGSTEKFVGQDVTNPTTYAAFYNNQVQEKLKKGGTVAIEDVVILDKKDLIGKNFREVTKLKSFVSTPANYRVSLKSYYEAVERLKNKQYKRVNEKTSDERTVEYYSKFLDKLKYIASIRVNVKGIIIDVINENDMENKLEKGNFAGGGKTYNGLRVPETVNTELLVSAFENGIDKNKIEKYTDVYREQMLSNEFPAILGYPSILDERDIGKYFMNGDEITEDDLGKQVWMVTDGHHRSISAIEAQVPYITVELDYSTITNKEDFKQFENGGELPLEINLEINLTPELNKLRELNKLLDAIPLASKRNEDNKEFNKLVDEKSEIEYAIKEKLKPIMMQYCDKADFEGAKWFVGNSYRELQTVGKTLLFRTILLLQGRHEGTLDSNYMPIKHKQGGDLHEINFDYKNRIVKGSGIQKLLVFLQETLPVDDTNFSKVAMEFFVKTKGIIKETEKAKFIKGMEDFPYLSYTINTGLVEGTEDEFQTVIFIGDKENFKEGGQPEPEPKERLTNVTEICSRIRVHLKEKYPNIKFSVRKQHTSSLSVNWLSADFNPFVEEKLDEYQQKSRNIQLNQYYIKDDERITDKAKKLLEDVIKFSNQWNWNRSDYMTDYFDVNYYFHIEIGDWDKPFEVVKPKEIPKPTPRPEKTPELPKPKGKVNTLRIVEYSEKSVVIIGDTYPIKSLLKELGGFWNNRAVGWLFPKSKIEGVKKLVIEAVGDVFVSDLEDALTYVKSLRSDEKSNEMMEHGGVTKLKDGSVMQFEDIFNEEEQFIGISGILNNKLVGAIRITGAKLIDGKKYLYISSAKSYYQKQGVATSLYKKLLEYAKEDGYDGLYSESLTSIIKENILSKFVVSFIGKNEYILTDVKPNEEAELSHVENDHKIGTEITPNFITAKQAEIGKKYWYNSSNNNNGQWLEKEEWRNGTVVNTDIRIQYFDFVEISLVDSKGRTTAEFVPANIKLYYSLPVAHKHSVCIALKGDYVLMGKAKTNDDRNGTLCFVGGGIKEGETIFQAAIRECKEESGLDVKAIKQLYYPRVTDVAFVVCEFVGGEIKPNHEFENLAFYSLNDLPDNIYSKNIEILNHLRAVKEAFKAGQQQIWEDLEQTNMVAKFDSFEEWFSSADIKFATGGEVIENKPMTEPMYDDKGDLIKSFYTTANHYRTNTLDEAKIYVANDVLAVIHYVFWDFKTSRYYSFKVHGLGVGVGAFATGGEVNKDNETVAWVIKYHSQDGADNIVSAYLKKDTQLFFDDEWFKKQIERTFQTYDSYIKLSELFNEQERVWREKSKDAERSAEEREGFEMLAILCQEVFPMVVEILNLKPEKPKEESYSDDIQVIVAGEGVEFKGKYPEAKAFFDDYVKANPSKYVSLIDNETGAWIIEKAGEPEKPEKPEIIIEKPEKPEPKVIRPKNLSHLKEWLKQNQGNFIYVTNEIHKDENGRLRTENEKRPIGVVQTNSFTTINKQGKDMWIEFPKVANMMFTDEAFIFDAANNQFKTPNTKVYYYYESQDKSEPKPAPEIIPVPEPVPIPTDWLQNLPSLEEVVSAQPEPIPVPESSRIYLDEKTLWDVYRSFVAMNGEFNELTFEQFVGQSEKDEWSSAYYIRPNAVHKKFNTLQEAIDFGLYSNGIPEGLRNSVMFADLKQYDESIDKKSKRYQYHNNHYFFLIAPHYKDKKIEYYEVHFSKTFTYDLSESVIESAYLKYSALVNMQTMKKMIRFVEQLKEL